MNDGDVQKKRIANDGAKIRAPTIQRRLFKLSEEASIMKERGKKTKDEVMTCSDGAATKLDARKKVVRRERRATKAGRRKIRRGGESEAKIRGETEVVIRQGKLWASRHRGEPQRGGGR